MPIRSLSPGTDKWSGRTGCNIQVRITGVATYTEKKRKSTERTEDVANVKQGKTGAMRHASRLFAPAIRSTWRQAPCSLHLWDFITTPLLCFRIKMSQIFVTCTQRWFPKTWKRLRGFFFFCLTILSLPLKTFFPTLSEVFSVSISADPSKSLARMGSDCQFLREHRVCAWRLLTGYSWTCLFISASAPLSNPLKQIHYLTWPRSYKNTDGWKK